MTFTETWYSDKQCETVANLARQAPSDGEIIEIGCWEGKSTTAIANAVFPRNVFAIDHWLGNLEEDPNHPSVIAAQQRDVYKTFLANCKQLTKGNIIPIRRAWQDAWPILFSNKQVAFIHIDAAHDYCSVLRTLEQVSPQMCANGIMCGDDFLTASANRLDLNGGVERAVREYFGAIGIQVHNDNNLWWIIKHEDLR